MPEKVEFTGTIGNTVAETTQRTFKGTATTDRPSRVVRNVITITIALPITVTLFKIAFDFNPTLYFPTIPQTYTPPQATKELPPADEPLSTKLRAFGIDSYIVIVSVCDNEAQATELEYVLRQKRTHAKHLVYKSRYYVYVGPLYGKQRVNSALKSFYRLGYPEAYFLYPE